MFKRVLAMSVGAALCMAMTATSAMAVPISGTNVRPVATAGVLQPVLDAIYSCAGCVAEIAGQSSVSAWQLAGVPPVGTLPVLYLESAGNAGSNSFGIVGGTDSSSLTLTPIFFGAATAGAASSLVWMTPTTLFMSGIGAGTNSGVFTVDKNFFGFYLSGPGGTMYSADQLNTGGAAQMLAYLGGPTRWTFGFEDTYGGDRDFNDMVVTVESITPAIPEPGSLILLGTGLVGVAKRLRRRVKA